MPTSPAARLPFRRSIASIALGAALLAGVAGTPAIAQPSAPTRTIDQWDVPKKGVRLAIDGYDPVSYFPEGGGKPLKGSAQFEHLHGGVTYRFSSAQTRQRFIADPARYEPAHGGWCSWAMIDGDKTEPNPKSFIVKDGRLFLFYDGLLGDTRANWLKGDHAAQLAKADVAWKKISGEEPRMPRTLAQRLDERRAEFDRKAPVEMKERFEKGVRDVAGSGVLERALKVGSTAPDFTLKNAAGADVHLRDLLAKGPVVLTWYRGGWCPYCSIQLRAMQEVLPELTAAGAHVVALSPEKPDATAKTAESNLLGFTVLSDAGNQVGKRYGVVYELPPDLVQALKGVLDLPTINGTTEWELPIAATYVIDRDGRITYAFLDADYRKRAEPSEIIDAARQLSKSK
ncbi:MAG: peroxiredoxin-like family protein [Planctomycetota bacterium]|nr:peroxiredoxin-like family protein [Planctomycetota bacterium]